MKTTLLTLSLVFSLSVFAQTHQLVKHDGSEHPVNFIKHETDLIHYSHPESFEHQKMSSHAVATLKNIQTSEIKIISDKVEVLTKSDYDKVKVLNQPDESIGLKQVAVFKGQLNKTKGISSSEQFDKTIRHAKYKAADKGYPFIAVNKKLNGTYEAIAYNY